MSYDPNGNIQTLRRYNEQGLIQHDFNYHYKYEDQSPTYNNQLQSVSGYTNAYSYNALGQMIGEDKVEEGKDQYVEYDVSGKVVKVFSDPAKTQASLKIENLYDDRGFRLAKINYATSRTTWYIRDASGNVISIYEQDGIASEATAATSEITLTEVPVYGAGKLGTTYPQEDGSTNYEITDHLGNVRALVRDNINVYVATMEDNGVEDEEDPFANPRIEEMQYFENLFETEVDDVHMNVTPPSAKVTNPDKASYLFWNDTPGTTKEEKAIGPSIALKVNKGDKIDVSVWARYEEKLNYARDFNLTALSGLLGSTFVSQTGFEGYSTTQTSSTLLGALTAAAFGTDTDNTRPYAYLNYVILDNALGYRNGDAARVPETAGSEPAELYLPANKPVKFGFGEEIVVEEDGYIYIWVSNESHSTRVWFDDLTVTHEQNLVVQASDYGVWGDLLREQRTDDKKYRFGYQGQYAEKDEETGWNHFELREYDPVTGRWTIGDPYRQFFSAYLALGNNPVNLRDRDGGKGEIIPGADGKPISAEVQDGKIVITENGTEQLQHLVNLINASGSTNAVEDFMNAVQSPGIVNVVLDLVNTPPLYGYHQPHDANGRALVWDATKQKFDGIPAVIKAPDGSLRYKEATVTLYLLNMWSARDRLPGIVKHQLGITDMKVTVKEFIVDVFSHEMYHNLDQGSIYKTSTQDNSYDFEGPAYQREWETHLQIMNNRP
jgi:RHS repeat-associated protein